MKPFLFIDRDGTLIEEPADQQIDSLEKFKLYPDVIPALLDLSRAGYSLVMVSNQDGLGTAANPQEKFAMIQELLLTILKSQGIEFAEILICPHTSIEGCRCRKPQTQLVKHYLAANEMDRERSYVIGDRPTDLDLAENMGLRGLRLTPEFGWKQVVQSILIKPRSAVVKRKTKETEIEARVTLEGQNRIEVHTGIGFFDHMLDQLARHGGFDLFLKAHGDLHIDEHHLVEDVALTIGAALRKALGEKRGIQRYGFWLPMDEANSRATLDLSGRAHFQMLAPFPAGNVGGLSTEMIPHFFRSLADSMAMSLHIETVGENSHHMVESTFKGVGRSLRQAFARSEDTSIPSTKGSL